MNNAKTCEYESSEDYLLFLRMNFIDKAKKLAKDSYLVRFGTWILLFNFIDLLAIKLPIFANGTTRKRVVFVRLDAIGDYIIWTSVFDAIKDIYPSKDFERVLIGNEAWRELADKEEIFDEKIFVDRKKLVKSVLYRFRVFRSLSGLKADIVVNPTMSRDFLWADSAIRCCDAPEKIGCAGIANRMSERQERLSNQWYTMLMPALNSQEHALVSDFRFISQLDPLKRNFKLRSPRLPFPDQDVSSNGGSEYVVIFPGAQFAFKRWPIENFAAIADLIRSEYGFRIFLCGGPGEEHLAKEFSNYFLGDFTDLIGKTSFVAFANVLRSARFIVTNDTSAGHIAAAVNCPSLIVYPGAYEGRFFPYPAELGNKIAPQICITHHMPCFGCGWNCVYHDLKIDDPKPCIANIEVDKVFTGIQTLVSKTETSLEGTVGRSKNLPGADDLSI